MVERDGFEPSKAEPSDLQSDSFDHSETSPKKINYSSLDSMYSSRSAKSI